MALHIMYAWSMIKQAVVCEAILCSRVMVEGLWAIFHSIEQLIVWTKIQHIHQVYDLLLTLMLPHRLVR